MRRAEAGPRPAAELTPEKDASMTRLSRVMMGAALVLGLATTTRAAEPDKLLPADTDTVAIVNLRQIIGSDIIKKYALEQIKQALEGQDAKKILEDLGLDPLKDVEKIVVGSVETQFKKDAQPKFLIIVHGKFDAEKLYKTAEVESKREGSKISLVKDGDTVMFKFEPGGAQGPVYGTVVNEKTVIAGSDKALITTALKASDASKPAALKKELTTLLAKLDDKASISVASLVKGKLDEVKLPAGGGIPVKLDGLEKAIPKMETVAVSIKIGTDVLLDLTIGMKDEDAAGDMRNALDDLFRDLKPLVQGLGEFEPRAKPLADVLASVKITSKNKDVTLTGKVTGDNIGKMVAPKN
jgi:hypothetical protein